MRIEGSVFLWVHPLCGKVTHDGTGLAYFSEQSIGCLAFDSNKDGRNCRDRGRQRRSPAGSFDLSRRMIDSYVSS